MPLSFARESSRIRAVPDFFTLIAKNQERRFWQSPGCVSFGAVAADRLQRSAIRIRAAAPLRGDSREKGTSSFPERCNYGRT